MFIKFSVSNFLSFYKKQEFSMLSGATKLKSNHIINNNELKLLKFSSIYGANGAGKTNIIKAIDFAKLIILFGIESDCSNLYCRIKEKYKNDDSVFEFTFSINNKIFKYGFSVNLFLNSLRKEWLYEINNNDLVKIFTRNSKEDIILNEDYFGNEIIERLKMYANDSKNQDLKLFLTIMNKDKESLYENNESVNVFKNIYDWIKNSIVIISPNKSLTSLQYFITGQNVEKINFIISKLGTGISNCEFKKISEDEIKAKIPPFILKDICSELEKRYLENKKNGINKSVFCTFSGNNDKFSIVRRENGYDFSKMCLKHINSEGIYNFSEESDGTRRLFDLIDILIEKNSEKVYFVDEFDRCFHPQLTYKFVEVFLDNNKNYNNQLIITTHESRLLNFNILRRDEVWFANREDYGPTELYSLEVFNERFDKKIDKAYLEGKYKGVPIFETLFPIDDRK